MKVIACARFTEEMAAALYHDFHLYSSENIVAVEIASNGLWLVQPTGARKFLGVAGRESKTDEKPDAAGIESD